MGGGGAERGIRGGVARIEILAGVTVVALAAWFIVPGLGRARVDADRQACLANLNEIGRALGSYLAANDERWPYVAKLRSFKVHQPPWPTLPEVLGPFAGGQSDMFHCPADVRVLEPNDSLAGKFPLETTWFATEGLSYGWRWAEDRGGQKLGHSPLSRANGSGLGRADQTVLTDFELFHVGDGGGSFNTLFADFRARTSRARPED